MKTNTYAGIEEKFAKLENAKVALIPVPYDGTSTWQKGADKGPEAFLEASENMELFDIETATEVYKQGVYLANPVTGLENPEQMVSSVHNTVKSFIQKKKFVTIVGGEHSVSIGAIRAFNESYNNLTVLHIDAHADLRKSYEGTPFNHACAMYEASQNTNLVQVGIRSMDKIETTVVDEDKIFYAHTMVDDESWIDNALDSMGENVYISFDLDAFDPSIMPATGTPEPGGLLWYETLDFLKQVFEEKNVVGFDIVELCPNPAHKASDFLAAKLYYKMLTYKFLDEDIEDDFDNGNTIQKNEKTHLNYNDDEFE
ncbi:agmatinase [Lutibacter sp. TH_r2]|uniref:agmatinase n=1 Tax=Lutibacter sp. TH_r2 TaxID=3082083 RepID=UPI0029550ECA|nr:agmatinase [Lutibacter sp. TH_r2]MDV7186458.1 agmatinase [Lutibacter sp. TH_r2]